MKTTKPQTQKIVLLSAKEPNRANGSFFDDDYLTDDDHQEMLHRMEKISRQPETSQSQKIRAQEFRSSISSRTSTNHRLVSDLAISSHRQHYQGWERYDEELQLSELYI